jgi:hypothetical protein
MNQEETIRKLEQQFPYFRQSYYAAHGVCEVDGCREVEHLEFHKIINQKQAVLLNKYMIDVGLVLVLCRNHHRVVHFDVESELPIKTERLFLAELVQWEINKCGGYEKWKDRFQLNFTSGGLDYT